MIPPDYPRLPHSYKLKLDRIRSASESIAAPQLSSSSATAQATLRAAAALALAAHAGEDRYAFEVELGQAVEGEIERDSSDAKSSLLAQVAVTKAKPAEDLLRLQVLLAAAPSEEQTTPLRLAFDPETSQFSLNYDTSLVTDLEAKWFLSHVANAYTSLRSSGSESLSQVCLAPASESAKLAKLSRASPPPSVYPEDCNTLPAFFLHAANLYPDDPALHYSSSPEAPRSEDVVLSFSQLLHLARHFASTLLSSLPPGVTEATSDYVVPLCVDKSPEMIISMVAITLAGFGYLALEPSWPEGRKQTILRELANERKLAGVAIVQSTAAEDGKWRTWTVEGTERLLLSKVIDPASVVRGLDAAKLGRMEEEYPLEKREWPMPRQDGIAYVIYTSGTTGVPKGIEVQHRNVAAFLR